MLKDVPWVELRVHEREWWGGSRKGTINYPVISGLEWKARSKGALPIAMTGHQSLNKYSLTLGGYRGYKKTR